MLLFSAYTPSFLFITFLFRRPPFRSLSFGILRKGEMRRKTVNGKLKRLSERSPLKQKKALPKAGKRSSAAADGASAAHARQRAARHCRRHRRQPGRGCGQHFHRAGRATVVQAVSALSDFLLPELVALRLCAQRADSAARVAGLRGAARTPDCSSA